MVKFGVDSREVSVEPQLKCVAATSAATIKLERKYPKKFKIASAATPDRAPQTQFAASPGGSQELTLDDLTVGE